MGCDDLVYSQNEASPLISGCCFLCVLVIHRISQSVGSLFVLARLATRGSMIKCWPASLRMLVVVPVEGHFVLETILFDMLRWTFLIQTLF